MAPLKFEDTIKSKLEERSLSPSAEAWTKLSDRLDAETQSTKKSKYWWWSIAASLLIMLAVSVQWLQKEETKQLAPVVVQETIAIPTQETPKALSFEQIPVDVTEDAKLKQAKKVRINREQPSNLERKTPAALKASSSLELTSETQTSPVDDSLLYDETEALLRAAQIEMAIGSAKEAIKLEHSAVSDAEIDALLSLASQELFKEQLEPERIQTADATRLLERVEAEMGQSFRTKVFEALKESFETVRTAVAQRNH